MTRALASGLVLACLAGAAWAVRRRRAVRIVTDAVPVAPETVADAVADAADEPGDSLHGDVIAVSPLTAWHFCAKSPSESVH